MILRPQLFCVTLLLQILPLAVAAQERADVRSEGYLKDTMAAYRVSQQIDSAIEYASALAFEHNTEDTALVMLSEALHVSDSLNYGKGIVQSCITIGNVFNIRGVSDLAISYFMRALKRAEKDNLVFYQEILYGNLAGIYQAKDQYELSLRYYLKAIEAIKRSFSIHNLSNAAYSVCVDYTNMAAVLDRLYNHDQALQYASTAEAIAYAAGFSSLLPHIKGTKAAVLINLGSINDARDLCFEIGKEAQDRDILLTVELLLGEINEKEHNIKAALDCFRRANALSSFAADKILAICSLARIHYNLSETDSAAWYAREGIALATQYDAREPLVEFYGILASVTQRLGNYKDALSYYNSYRLLEDSLRSILKNRMIYTLETQYRAAEKDRSITAGRLTIAQQQSKLAKQRLLIGVIILSAILLIFCVLFCLFYYRKLHRQQIYFLQQQERTRSLLALTEGEEKERRRVASDLHDGIGGLLWMVRMYFSKVRRKNPVLSRDSEFIEGMQLLEQSLNEVRKTAHNLMPELLLQYGLPEALRIFCNNIQSLRQIQINFQYYGFIGRLNRNFELFIYRTVQELVQNILKHSNAKNVLLQLSLHDNMLSITVEDDGIGFDEDQHTSGSGLVSIRNRIRELSGELAITSVAGKGTSVVIEFDLKARQILIDED